MKLLLTLDYSDPLPVLLPQIGPVHTSDYFSSDLSLECISTGLCHVQIPRCVISIHEDQMMLVLTSLIMALFRPGVNVRPERSDYRWSAPSTSVHTWH